MSLTCPRYVQAWRRQRHLTETTLRPCDVYHVREGAEGRVA